MKTAFNHRLLVLAVFLCFPCLSLPADEPNRPAPQTDLDKARLQLAEAELRLHRAERLNKMCAGFMSEEEDAARVVAADARIRVDLHTLIDLRHKQIRRGAIERKVGMEEIQKMQKVLQLLTR
jgi:hypothetical protein